VATGPVTLAATPVEIDEVPPPTATDEMALGAAIFEPEDATFDVPVAVTVPVDVKLPAGTVIPLKKYEGGEWVTIGEATVGEDGLSATGDVTEFGQLSVQPKVETAVVPDEEPEEEPGSEVTLQSTAQTVEVEVEDTITFPQGLPDGVTEKYARALIQQLKGLIGGSSTQILSIPSVAKLALKAASPLSAEGVEYWQQTCTYRVVTTIENETITITITIPGTDTVVTITLPYLVSRQRAELNCTQTWIEHSQGGGS
jgi:hypothetical protein